MPLQFSLLGHFALFVPVLCLLFPMLPVSLNCQFLIAPTVFFVVEFVLFFLVLCLLFPMLPVSLDCQFLIAPTVFFVMEFCFVCPRLMSFVSHVASVSRLSILDCPYSFLCCGIISYLRVDPWALRLYHSEALLYSLRRSRRLYSGVEGWYNLNAHGSTRR